MKGNSMRKTAAVALILVCLMVLGVVCVRPVKAQSLGLITINSDGSVTPSTAPIHRVGNTYTLTNNIINGTIEVQRSDVVVDGAGFTIQGFNVLIEGILPGGFPADSEGITLSDVSNVTLKDFNINTFYEGIDLVGSANNTIERNAITTDICISLDSSSNGNRIISNIITSVSGLGAAGVECEASYNDISDNYFNGSGVSISGSIYPLNAWQPKYNTISENLFNTCGIVSSVGSSNKILNNKIIDGGMGIIIGDYSDLISGNYISGNSICGIDITQFQSNQVVENYIANNAIGIALGSVGSPSGYPGELQAINNNIYHNDFIGNTENAHLESNSDGSYPVNYWDNGSSGNYWSDYLTIYPNATEIGSSGIGDTPYIIEPNNVDNYPLIAPLSIIFPSIPVPALPPNSTFYALETNPPVISVLSPVNQTYNESNVPLTFTVDKTVNWIGYSLDDEQNVTITGNTTVANVTNGLHSITVYANDTFGNIGASENITFQVQLPELPKPFPTATVAAASGTSAVVVVGAGLLVYFKKHRH